MAAKRSGNRRKPALKNVGPLVQAIEKSVRSILRTKDETTVREIYNYVLSEYHVSIRSGTRLTPQRVTAVLGKLKWIEGVLKPDHNVKYYRRVARQSANQKGNDMTSPKPPVNAPANPADVQAGIDAAVAAATAAIKQQSDQLQLQLNAAQTEVGTLKGQLAESVPKSEVTKLLEQEKQRLETEAKEQLSKAVAAAEAQLTTDEQAALKELRRTTETQAGRLKTMKYWLIGLVTVLVLTGIGGAVFLAVGQQQGSSLQLEELTAPVE